MTEALETARSLCRLFPKDAYVQAVRTSGAEDDIEQFYRFWKAEGVNIIIQKYDSCCKTLPDLLASDLSPVERQPCWHIKRDMSILIAGRAPRCKEVALSKDAEACGVLGNVFSDSLEAIWRQ